MPSSSRFTPFPRFLVACPLIVALTAVCVGAAPRTQTQTPAPPPTESPAQSPTQDVPPALASLLAKPISTGAIAALATHAAHPAAQRRMRDALADKRAPVRAVAARVAAATGSRSLLQTMRIALQTEQDPLVAAEMIPLVVQYGTAEQYADALAAATRLKADAAMAFVNTLARLNRSELIDQLTDLFALDSAGRHLVTPALTLTSEDAETRAKVVDAFARRADTLHTLTNALRKRNDALPDGRLEAWLRSDQEGIRSAASWYLVFAASADAKSTSDAATVPASSPASASASAPTAVSSAPRTLPAVLDEFRTAHPGAVTWEALAVEVLARANDRPRDVRSWRALAQADTLMSLRETLRSKGVPLLVRQMLTRSELEELSEIVFGDKARLAAKPDAAATAAPKPAASEPEIGMRSVPPIAEGLWKDLLDVLGCQPARNELVTGNVGYRPDGRVRKITLNPGASEACRSAATVLFMLTPSYEDAPASADAVDTLIAYFDPDVVACGNEPMQPNEIPNTAASDANTSPNVQPPKRTRYREPTYPEAEQRAHHEGAVVVVAQLSRGGCVQTTRLTRSVSPTLDLSAMAAVLTWKYSPTVVNGKPMRVVMTAAVNFTVP